MQYLPMNSFRIFWALTDQQCRFFHSHLYKTYSVGTLGILMFAFLDVFFILSFAEAWSWSWLVGRGVGGRVGGWGSLVLFSIGRKFDSHSRFHPLHNIHLHHPFIIREIVLCTTISILATLVFVSVWYRSVLSV